MGLILITREEAEMLRRETPNAHIAIVNAHHKSKRKKYYIEEASAVLAVLEKTRPGWRSERVRWRK